MYDDCHQLQGELDGCGVHYRIDCFLHCWQYFQGKDLLAQQSIMNTEVQVRHKKYREKPTHARANIWDFGGFSGWPNEVNEDSLIQSDFKVTERCDATGWTGLDKNVPPLFLQRLNL